jgi:hypothetical protein
MRELSDGGLGIDLELEYVPGNTQHTVPENINNTKNILKTAELSILSNYLNSLS